MVAAFCLLSKPPNLDPPRATLQIKPGQMQFATHPLGSTGFIILELFMLRRNLGMQRLCKRYNYQFPGPTLVCPHEGIRFEGHFCGQVEISHCWKSALDGIEGIVAEGPGCIFLQQSQFKAPSVTFMVGVALATLLHTTAGVTDPFGTSAEFTIHHKAEDHRERCIRAACIEENGN